MKTSIDKKDVQVILTIELTAADWKQVLEAAATRISKSVEIKGFRGGKAPVDVVANQVGEARVVSEASDLAVNKFYAAAVEEHKLKPVVPPKISVERVDLTKPLVFKAEVTVMPEVVLGDYKKIRVVKQAIKVDPAQVEKVLANLQRRSAEFEEVNRASQAGDWVEIDFEGKLDGKSFEGGSSKHHPLIIGDGVFLPGFEAALVGIKAGENKTFTVTFPADYQQSALAGKKVEFAVKLHKVKKVKLPPIDDELAKKVGKFETLKDLQADVEKWIEVDAAKQERSRQQEAAMNQLIEMTQAKIPDELIDQELSSMIGDLSGELSRQNTTLEDYLKKNNTTEGGLRQQWRNMAKQRVMAGLALDAFKRREKIEATDEEVQQDIERMKQLYPNEKDKIEEKYSSDLDKRRLKHLLSGQKALEHLIRLATS